MWLLWKGYCVVRVFIGMRPDVSKPRLGSWQQGLGLGVETFNCVLISCLARGNSGQKLDIA